MSYIPEYAPESYDNAYIMRELNRISAQIGLINDYQVLHAAPAKLKHGMVRYADGTDWDPGSGEGLYRYNGSAWVHLG